MVVILNILNASGALSNLCDAIEHCHKSSMSAIRKLLPVAEVDVVVLAGGNVIPELGMLGYAPDRHHIYITIDPENQNLLLNFEEEYRAALGHELHHCMRHSGPGYGTTLREALVSEGLACKFETELRRDGAAPIYAVQVGDKCLSNLLAKVALESDQTPYDHFGWFFGSTERKIPRWAGYSLGYKWANEYVARTGTPASRLWDADAKSIAAYV